MFDTETEFVGYSEGNTYKSLQRWTVFVRESINDAWVVSHVTEDSDAVAEVIRLNQEAGWQKFAIAQHTV